MLPVRAFVTAAVIITAGAAASAEPCADVTKLACSTGTVADGAGVLVCAAPPGVEQVIVRTRSSPDAAWTEAPMARSSCRFVGRSPSTQDFEVDARDADGRVVATVESRAAATGREPAPPPCGVNPYLEPTLLLSTGVGGVVLRGAAGFHIHDCTRHRLHARAGISGYVDPGGGGVGGELELGVRAAPALVLGARGGIETVSNHGANFSTGATRFAVGVRVRSADSIVLAVDGFYQTDATAPGFSSEAGVMGGIGLDGRLGAYTSGIGLGASALIGLLVVAALAGTK